MNVKNLPLKFAFVALLVALCIVSIKTKGLKEGIDLNGGSIVIFDIRTPASEITRLSGEKKDLQAKLLTAANEREKADLQKQIDGLDAQIKYNQTATATTGNLAEEVIAILKKRVDPNGLYSLEWVPMGNSRIMVRMPAGQDESRKGKEAYNRALREAENHNITRSQMREVEQAPSADRPALLKKMNLNDTQVKSLVKLAADHDAWLAALERLPAARAHLREAEAEAKAHPGPKPATQATQPDPRVKEAREALKKAEDQANNLDVAYQKSQRAIEASNINEQSVLTVLRNFVSVQEASILKKSNFKEYTRRMEAYKKGLDGGDGLPGLRQKYAGREQDLQAIVSAYESWSNGRKRLDDPSDLVRLIRKAGVLEFRMAPYAPDAREGTAYRLSRDVADEYVHKLTVEGPDPGHKRNDPFQWFPLHDDDERLSEIIKGEYAGRTYVLLSNDPNDTMLNTPGADRWTLADAYPTSDEMGKPAVGFKFDAKGATISGRLTTLHKKTEGARVGDVMAVLLDDEVYSAPNIQATITDSGIISGSFTTQEVQDLVGTFKAGSLPARLNPDPVSVSTFQSGLGEINKKQSIKAGIIALAAVAVFMLLYYFLSGLIANLALALNIVMILGAMATFDAVFTMPGIAGLILTIGMAVDSNVLISERLREEQDRGLPIRLAFKNAYDRAFSAIFDSHLTALITCLVLYWVGTPEVRGFAVTLGLGVALNLFTAVFITKWIVMIMLRTGMIRSHQYMLRLIHVPKIDWMAKRYYFWAFSGITALLGIAALVSEGGRIWGIEFSAGTEATLVFRNDALLTVNGKPTLPNDNAVKELFKNAAGELGISTPVSENKDFSNLHDNTLVETMVDPDRVEKFMRLYAPFDSGRSDNKITLEQWKAANGNPEFFRLVDTNHDGVLEQAELEKSLPQNAYHVKTTETHLDMIREVARKAFGPALANRQKISYHLADSEDEQSKGAEADKLVKLDSALYDQLGVPCDSKGLTLITSKLLDKAKERAKAHPELASFTNDLEDFQGGVLLVVDNLDPAVTKMELEQRLGDMRVQPDETLANQAINPVRFIELKPTGDNPRPAFAILSSPADPTMVASREAKARFAETEAKLMNEVLVREDSITAVHIDPQVAGQTKQRAMIAVVLSWLAIIAYLWLRFGTASWGLAAVICLIHDSIIVVGMVAVSDWISHTSIGQWAMVGSFKIDLPMIAAVLTIIGYSVSDTIVVFDRIRENRGKLKTVSYQVINNSINQTLSRTILTVFTVFIVVFVMYVWGGESIRGFNYALLVGIFFGCYSSIAVASPILLGFKQMVSTRALAVTEAAKTAGKPMPNPDSTTPPASQGK